MIILKIFAPTINSFLNDSISQKGKERATFVESRTFHNTRLMLIKLEMSEISLQKKKEELNEAFSVTYRKEKVIR